MNNIENNPVLVKIQEELKKFEDKKKQLVEELRKEFPNLFKSLFEQTDKIKSFSWTQYTPYFNDGDECVFRVNGVYTVNENDIDEEEWYDWRIRYYLRGDKEYSNLLEEKPNIDINTYKIYELIEKTLETIPEDFMRDLFGDHVQITVFKDGEIRVEEYDHD